MPVAQIFDAARNTRDFFHDTGEPELISWTSRQIVFRSEILSGRFEGEIARIVWIGDFDPDSGSGEVTEIRERIDGDLHFSVVFDKPVSLENLFGGLEEQFAAGMRLIGNSYANRLEGDVGNDTLIGNGGDDVLIGRAGSDTLRAGAGDDVLDGRDRAFDTLIGGRGDDTYLVNQDDVVEKADGGHDVVKSWNQQEALAPGVEDLIMMKEYEYAVNAYGNDGDNVIKGSQGRDVIGGYGGNDTLYGRGGDDSIFGSTGNTTLFGGDGNDELYDYNGRNSLSGGNGRDTLISGTGRDTLSGGNGRDTFIFGSIEAAGTSAARHTLITDFLSGTDTLDLTYIDANINRPAPQDFVFIGDAKFSGEAGELRYAKGMVTGDVDGDARPDFWIELKNAPPLVAGDIRGLAGTPPAEGAPATLIEVGEAAGATEGRVSVDGKGTGWATSEISLLQSDHVDGGPLDGKPIYLEARGEFAIYDSIDGPYPGRVDSVVIGLDSSGKTIWTETYLVPLDFVSIHLGARTFDRIFDKADLAARNGVEFVGNSFANTWSGRAGDDILAGNAGRDRLTGGGGADTLLGGDDPDWLDGERGNDRIGGGAGNDRITGGSGADLLRGNGGRDVFLFNAVSESTPERTDKIADFVSGRDLIDLNAIDARADRPGDQAFRFVDGGLSGAAGELFFADGLVLGDTDGDGVADLAIAVDSPTALEAGDFLL